MTNAQLFSAPLATCLLLGWAGTAGAQQATAQAQVGMGLPGAAPQTTATTASTTTTTTTPATLGYGATDHGRVVGHLGVGYLGRSEIQVGTTNGATLQAPTIGVRYWLSPLLGIDAGLGLGFQGGSSTVAGVKTGNPSLWAFLIHGGVPLALATGQHYAFEVVPEFNLGFGGGSDDANSYHGVLFDLGARAGAEVQFGFIGIPELALQASVGLMYSLTSASTTVDASGQKSSVTASQFRTTVYGSPWAIFTNSLTALYYF